LRKIPSGDFEKFLRLVDEELAEPFTIIVVGGAAIGMAYAPDHSTSDIDLMPLRFIGHPANLKPSFLALPARLSGEEEAKRVDREIR
jgi:hypothetical protein